MPCPRFNIAMAATALALSTVMQTAPALAGGPPRAATVPHDTAVPENRRARRVIELYDLNGDARVSGAEIAGDQKRFFTALDVDGNGRLSAAEFKRRARALRLFATTSLFDMLDSDGDGQLSAAEIQGPSKRWLNRFDTNRDGILEYREIPSRPVRRRGRFRGRGRGRGGRLIQ